MHSQADKGSGRQNNLLKLTGKRQSTGLSIGGTAFGENQDFIPAHMFTPDRCIGFNGKSLILGIQAESHIFSTARSLAELPESDLLENRFFYQAAAKAADIHINDSPGQHLFQGKRPDLSVIMISEENRDQMRLPLICYSAQVCATCYSGIKKEQSLNRIARGNNISIKKEKVLIIPAQKMIPYPVSTAYYFGDWRPGNVIF